MSLIKLMTVVSNAQRANVAISNPEKAVSNAQHANLAISNPEKIERSRSKRRSNRSSRERKKIVKMLTKLIESKTLSIAELDFHLDFLLKPENNALKSQLQHMEQQIQTKDSLNDALRMENYHLKIATGQVVPNDEPVWMMPFGVPHNFALNPHFYGEPHAMSAQQLQLNQPPHLRPHPPQPQQIMMQQQQAVQVPMMMPSQAPIQMQLQPQVMMLPHNQGLIQPSSMPVQPIKPILVQVAPDQYVDAAGGDETGQGSE